MAGYSKIYVIGGLGGFLGSDGVNPIEFMILVGEGNRQWLEPHYFDKTIKPLGLLQTIVPARPDDLDSLLDACLAFCPRNFSSCPSLAKVEAALQNVNRLDFDLSPQEIPPAWSTLRQEARQIFSSMNIWQANLTPVNIR